MKIKMNKERQKREKQNIKNILNKRIKIPKIIRSVAIGILLLVLLFSIIQVNAAYQKSETTQRSIPLLSYTQSGAYTYKVYLKNNTVYEQEYLTQNDNAKIFKKLVDRIDITFTYSFNIDTTASIVGNYFITAQIQTDIWSKTYTIVPTKNFNANGRQFTFTEGFLLDYGFYENITSQIDGETGVTAPNPKVVIKSSIAITATMVGKEPISKLLSPEISIPLGAKTIDFPTQLSTTSAETKSEKKEVFHQETIDERNTWTTRSYIIFGLIILILAITRTKAAKLTEIEKSANKIKKKYGEWIVEVNKPPKITLGSDIIYCKTIDDLMKISEELGKPVIHNELEKDIHIFHVIDGSAQYQFVLSEDTKLSKNIRCPECETKIETSGALGESVQVTCPKCGKQFDTTI